MASPSSLLALSEFTGGDRVESPSAKPRPNPLLYAMYGSRIVEAKRIPDDIDDTLVSFPTNDALWTRERKQLAERYRFKGVANPLVTSGVYSLTNTSLETRTEVHPVLGEIPRRTSLVRAGDWVIRYDDRRFEASRPHLDGTRDWVWGTTPPYQNETGTTWSDSHEAWVSLHAAIADANKAARVESA